MKNPLLKIYLFAFLFITLNACQSTKYLQENEQLYAGAKLKIEKPNQGQPNKSKRSDLEQKIRQQPNRSFNLWVYQRLRNLKKTRGLRHWIKTKVGEAPVIYAPVQTERSRLIMENYLQENGFLNAEVNVDTTVKGKKVYVEYLIKGNGQYSINDYHLPPDSTELLQLIKEKSNKPLVKKGKTYTTTTLDAERLRLENLTRNNGFFEFNKNSIYFYVDTSIQKNKAVDIYLDIKPSVSRQNDQLFKLGTINFYPDYSLEKNHLEKINLDTISEGQWNMIQSKEIVKLKALQEAISQDSGAIYSLNLERQSINYLLDFGIFKFVNLKYRKDTIQGQPILHREYYLTPNLNQDLEFNLEASTERTNFLGSAVGFNYVHRNAFRGAELFKTGLSFGTELQAGGDGPFVNTLEARYDASLTFPRLLLPFKINRRVKGAIPKTLIKANASFEQRNTLFTSFSTLAELAYTWKQTKKFQHRFAPTQITLINLLSTSDAFSEILENNNRLRASLDDLFIMSANYQFTFTDQILNARKNYWYLRTELETAGNLVTRFAPSQTINNREQKAIFNIPVAQFARVQTELRYTMYQRKTSIVGRLSLGLALPYGNSEAVPYTRQFFVGGASSNRAFRFRGVGPGTYTPPEEETNSNFAFFDRVGDLKIEGNIEFRFPLVSYLKGAVFLDAGNIWLTNRTADELPEGAFNINTFHKELAVGTGLGFRFDIQYVVLRFDFGFPIRDPGLAEDERWLIQEINFASRDWRRENIKFNLAIGYPF